MMEAQQMKLRQTRKMSQARQGQVPYKVEPINVFTCDGSRTKPSGEFVYLGTQIDPTCPATPEVRRRCGIACAVFDSLSTLWCSSSIATNVKGHLYCALGISGIIGVCCLLTQGGFLKTSPPTLPLPNSRCGPASHFGVKKTCQNGPKFKEQCRKKLARANRLTKCHSYSYAS